MQTPVESLGFDLHSATYCVKEHMILLKSAKRSKIPRMHTAAEHVFACERQSCPQAEGLACSYGVQCPVLHPSDTVYKSCEEEATARICQFWHKCCAVMSNGELC